MLIYVVMPSHVDERLVIRDWRWATGGATVESLIANRHSLSAMKE